MFHEIITNIAAFIIISICLMFIGYLIKDGHDTRKKKKEKAKADATPKEEPKATMIYRYNNANPIFDMNGDCAIRAISMLLKKDWTTVYTELFKLGIKHYRTFGNERNISTYLHIHGYEFIPVTDGKTPFKYFVNTEKEPIILDSKEHVAYAHGNIFYDSWDSSNTIITGYYREIKED